MGDVVHIDVDVRRLRLAPGDALVISTQQITSADEARLVTAYVRQWLMTHGHASTPVLLLNGAVAEVLTFEDAKSVVDQGPQAESEAADAG